MRITVAPLRWQRLGKNLERAQSYSQFLSLFGLLFTLVIGLAARDRSTLQTNIDHAFSLAKVGVYDLGALGYVSFDTILTALLIMGTAYLIVLLPVMIWLRFRWARKLTHYSVVQQPHQVQIVLTHAPTLTFCLLYATLRLKNLTTNQPLLVAPDPTALLKDNQFIFNLTSLPTSEYELTEAIFSFQDPLKLFETKQIVTLAHQTVYVHRPLSIRSLPHLQTQTLNVKNETLTQLSMQADQDWFSTRPYQLGDSLRHIHWKKTAQLQQLVVRKTEAKPFTRNRIKVYLSLYAPFYSKTSQARLIGNYLDTTLFELHQLTHLGWHCEIIFAATVTAAPLLLSKENFSHQIPVFLRRCRIQDKLPSDQFLTKQNATEGILFSLSSDISVKQFLRRTNFKVHLYFLGQDPFHTATTLIKAAFTNPKKYEPYLTTIFQHSFQPKFWWPELQLNRHIRRTEKLLKP